MDIEKYLEELTEKALGSGPEAIDAPEDHKPLGTVLKGHAIELWSTPAGRFFLVADDSDARLAMDRLGVGRGQLYTTAEARRIIAVNDPAVVAEIHEWKRRFDGVVQEFRRESPIK